MPSVMSSAISIMTYQTNPMDADSAKKVVSRLQVQEFRDPGLNSQIVFGWVPSPSMAVVSERIVEQAVLHAPYLLFSLRIDSRKVPGAVLKKETEKALSAWLEEHPGLARVPKQKKEEIKEAVTASLLAKTMPVPATYDVVWNIETGKVLLLTTNKKAMETFEVLMKMTAPEVALSPVSPFEAAGQTLSGDMRDEFGQRNNAQSSCYLDLCKDNAWLGTGFLRWLLWQSVDGSGAFDESGDVAYVNDRLRLVGPNESTGAQKMLFAGSIETPSLSPVRQALSDGKEITQAVVYVESTDGTWRFCIDADTFRFSGFKTPAVKVEKMDDPQAEVVGAFYEKIALIESGLTLFAGVLRGYLGRLLSPSWPEANRDMLDWMNEE